MNRLPLATLLGLAAFGAHAQIIPPPTFSSPDPVVVTATREIGPYNPTLRDTVVITREQLDDMGAVSLAEALQRLAGIEYRANGGPGQPAGIFIRGASPEQTLVLIDGMRAGSATTGTTAIEAIPLEMIERIEIVKGPMSSLYGSDAMGGVVQVFTRGMDVPHLFGSLSYGTDNDRRASTGLSTVDGAAAASISFGARKVDAPSATNPRAGLLYNPDRDPYENAFANLRGSYRLWTGEVIALEAFGTRARTRFDAGATGLDDWSDQTVSGARLTSSTHFTQAWASRLAYGASRDNLVLRGTFEGSRFETRQEQASWENEYRTGAGSVVGGYEVVRQKVGPDTTTDFITGQEIPAYSRTKRDIRSLYASVNETYQGQHVEANARRDDIQDFGVHDTGSVSYGYQFTPAFRLSGTVGRGFRAPTFNDLYSPFGGNPGLSPERSESREVTAKLTAGMADWRVTAFDNRFHDLIVFDLDQFKAINVNGARVRGVEISVSGTWLGLQWRGMFTAQHPRDEDTGKRLMSRADRMGSLDVSRKFGDSWTAGLGVAANGERFDSLDEAPESRLPGYAVVDARVRYRFAKQWAAELVGTNLGDKRYEGATGYDAPRRSVMLNLRFDAF